MRRLDTLTANAVRRTRWRITFAAALVYALRTAAVCGFASGALVLAWRVAGDPRLGTLAIAVGAVLALVLPGALIAAWLMRPGDGQILAALDKSNEAGGALAAAADGVAATAQLPGATTLPAVSVDCRRDLTLAAGSLAFASAAFLLPLGAESIGVRKAMKLDAATAQIKSRLDELRQCAVSGE